MDLGCHGASLPRDAEGYVLVSKSKSLRATLELAGGADPGRVAARWGAVNTAHARAALDRVKAGGPL